MSSSIRCKPSVADWGGGISVVQYRRSNILFAIAGNRWPHNAPWYHQLMPISCHFRDCEALLVLSLLMEQRYSKYPDLYIYRSFNSVKTQKPSVGAHSVTIMDMYRRPASPRDPEFVAADILSRLASGRGGDGN